MGRLIHPVDDSDHWAGSRKAPVVLVEYGDYECPHCARAHRGVAQVLRRGDDAVRFVFRHFPLAQIHPHAVLAAEAAETAGAQGRFWEMHNLLFVNQDALELTDLIALAESLELDLERFTAELRGNVHRARVDADFRSGLRNGVNGTPTFFLNDWRLDNDWDPTTLGAAISAARSSHSAP